MPGKPYTLGADPIIAVISQLAVDALTDMRKFGTTDDFNEVLVKLVAAWGRASGRLIDISSISQILNLPRTTTKRILDRLVARGEFEMKVHGKRHFYYRSESSLSGAQGVKYEELFQTVANRVQKAGELLSNMEGQRLPKYKPRDYRQIIGISPDPAKPPSRTEPTAYACVRCPNVARQYDRIDQ